jgi:hypothetical protein
VCEVCLKTDKKRGRRLIDLLECDRCLCGYHLDCLDPPLASVPDVSNLALPRNARSPTFTASKCFLHVCFKCATTSVISAIIGVTWSLSSCLFDFVEWNGPGLNIASDLKAHLG